MAITIETSHTEKLKQHLKEALSGKNAHITLEEVVRDFPLDTINEKSAGLPYSPWEILEHMRFAQHDILEFIRNPDYKEPVWPDDYWPEVNGDRERWEATVKRFQADRNELTRMIEKGDPDLFEPLPFASDYTLFREITLMVNHNSYHTGQLMLLKRILSGNEA
ncbi:DinB family protein [Robertkochia aurantiaca]|uniref:DinB family protein n=1 Tax=Robertkochia aurantiaca TaxID=2873700 RepID=UPI001CCE6FF5|nr:DinB family protein [Robertkochia sp. 3YJGBD-33]